MRDLPELDEAGLLAACRQGTPGAFARLYALHKDRAYSLALYMCGRHDQAEDILQQAFVQAHRSLDRFRGEARFGTWLHRVVVNLCLDARRKKKRVDLVSLEKVAPGELISGNQTDGSTLARDQLDSLNQALEKLRPEERSAILLKYVAGMTYEQIAESERVTKGTVGSRIHRGLKALRKHLERRDEHV